MQKYLDAYLINYEFWKTKKVSLQKVFFHYADKKLLLQNKLAIRKYVETIFETEEVHLTRLDYIFCSDEYLLHINQHFLNHNFYTDVITFNLSEDSGVKGEAYISVERVKDNAHDLTTPFKEEVLRVIFHGALHLCGYNDKSKQEQDSMRKKENYYLAAYKK